MAPLRQPMVEDTQVRNLFRHTHQTYVEQVSRFARHFGQSPEQLGADQIRAYQVCLIGELKLAPASLSVAAAARFSTPTHCGAHLARVTSLSIGRRRGCSPSNGRSGNRVWRRSPLARPGACREELIQRVGESTV